MRKSLFTLLVTLLGTVFHCAEKVHMDRQGVIRRTESHKEIALFGTNYYLPSVCNFCAVDYVSGDRKQMTVEDLEHFKRINQGGLYLRFQGDYQNTDREENLLESEHLYLSDYLIAEAGKRDIYMLLSPIMTYNSQWPEMNDITDTGLAKHYPKNTLIHDEEAIRAQENYMRQLLNHCNPYTGRCLKDEPNISLIELISEPTQLPEDIPGMVRYTNRIYKAIRSISCRRLTFYNVSRDFRVAPAVRKSDTQGSTRAWYSNALDSNYPIEGNGLLFVDYYEQMLYPDLHGRAEVVYEFDATDMASGFIFPAMTCEFRRDGIQFVAIFSCDMLCTAPMNLGQQTHFFNMVFTPSEAVNSMIATEVMRCIPHGRHFGYYPGNRTFDGFRVSYDEQLSELNPGDMFYYSNATSIHSKNLTALKYIAGVGSSPVARYSRTGIYSPDKQDDNTWQLETYPDVMDIDDPYKMLSKHRVSRESAYNERSIQIQPPGLKTGMVVLPGKYLLLGGKIISRKEPPVKDLYQTSMKEWKIANRTWPEFTADKGVTFRCEVFGPKHPQQVDVYLMLKPWGCKRIPMMAEDGFFCMVKVDISWLAKGDYEYHFGIDTGDDAILFLEKTCCTPERRDYYEQATYAMRLIDETTSLSLLEPQNN